MLHAFPHPSALPLPLSLCLCSWGWSYSFPSILIYLQQTDPWKESSLSALSAIGSILLAFQFFLPIVVISIFRRYPDWRISILSVAVAVNCLSMLASSWATEVRFFSPPFSSLVDS